MKQSNQTVKSNATRRAKGRLIRWIGGAAAFGAGCLWSLASAAADVAPSDSAAARKGNRASAWARC